MKIPYDLALSTTIIMPGLFSTTLMQVEASSVPGVTIFGAEAPEFRETLSRLMNRQDPCPVIAPALPFCVVVRNDSPKALALLGVRFDMIGSELKHYSVVHYADTLRNPEKSDLKSGAARVVCAEPLYTSMILRREETVHPRGEMNLANLRQMVAINAAIDCAAFDDGSFFGADTRNAFDRFALESVAEARLIEEVLRPGCPVVSFLEGVMEIPAEQIRDRALVARRTLAKHLAEGIYVGGIEEALNRARHHRSRIALHLG